MGNPSLKGLGRPWLTAETVSVTLSNVSQNASIRTLVPVTSVSLEATVFYPPGTFLCVPPGPVSTAPLSALLPSCGMATGSYGETTTFLGNTFTLSSLLRFLFFFFFPVVYKSSWYHLMMKTSTELTCLRGNGGTG